MSDEEEISDEILMAYSDGELAPDEQRRIEEKLIDDEELRERLAKLSDSPRNVGLDSLSPEFLADGFLDIPADRRKQPPDESQKISRDIEMIDDESVDSEKLVMSHYTLKN